MSRRTTIYPHNRIHSAALSVGQIRTDDGAVLENVERLDAEQYGSGRIVLSEATPEWEELEVAVELRLKSSELGEILPTVKSTDHDAIALVSVWCPSTKMRYGAGLEMESTGHWCGSVRLARSEVAGVVHLRPLLVRSRDAHSAAIGAQFATESRAILADGPAIEMVFDRSAASFHSDFEYHWVHFSKSTNAWLRERSADAFYCSFDAVPAIYLNLDLPSLQPILTNKSVVGAGVALRETYAAVIGQSTFTQLLVASVLSIRQADGQLIVDGPSWRADYVKALGGHLFPDLSDDEQLKQLFDQVTDPQSAGTLISQIGSVAQEFSRTGRRLSRAATAIPTETNASAGEED